MMTHDIKEFQMPILENLHTDKDLMNMFRALDYWLDNEEHRQMHLAIEMRSLRQIVALEIDHRLSARQKRISSEIKIENEK